MLDVIRKERWPATSPGGRALSLKTNFSWTFAGNVIYAACQWGMLVVLAKLGSPQVVGQFALGLAVTAPIIMLSNLQLRGVLATDAKEEHPFGDYLTLRVMTTAGALLTLAVVVAMAGYQRETALVVLAVGLFKSFESISDITYGLLQHQERMDRIARSMIIRGVFALVALWAGVYLTGSVLVGCLGVAAGWATVLVAHDLRAARKLVGSGCPGLDTGHRRPWEWARLYRLAVLAAPLGAVMMLGSLNVNIPLYVIQHYSGEQALGVFAAIAYLMVAGTTVVGALGQSASPRLAQYYAEGRHEEFRLLMRKLLVIGAALGIAGVLLAVAGGPMILSTLFRPEYAASADVLVWTMLAAAISYVASFLGYGLTAARQFKIQAPLLVIVTLATAMASVILVPRHGLVGAAWAVVFGAAVKLIGGAFILRHVMRMRVERLELSVSDQPLPIRTVVLT